MFDSNEVYCEKCRKVTTWEYVGRTNDGYNFYECDECESQRRLPVEQNEE